MLAAQKEEKSKAETESETDEPVYELDKDMTPPRIIKQVEPKYSESRNFRVEGKVALAVVVTSHGLPRDVHVVESLDPDVDRSAVEAVKQWRFDPAKKHGKAVATKVTVEIRFHQM